MNETIDLKISGASTMPGGEYAGVSISGAGKIQGNLRCARLHCSGAAKILGDVDCTGEIRSSGAGKVEGSAQCESLSSSGAFSVSSGLTVRTLVSSSGSVQAAQQLTADEIRSTGCLEAGRVHCRAFTSSGSCRISGDLEAETAVLTGAAEIGGLLNAETVEISAAAASVFCARTPLHSSACSAQAPAAQGSAPSRAMRSSLKMLKPRSCAGGMCASEKAAGSAAWNTAAR